MSSLIRCKSGVYYVVHSAGGKRVWRSLRTKNRKEAYQKFLVDKTPAQEPTEFTLTAASDEYLAYVKANHSAKTFKVYTGCLERLLRALGDKSVAAVVPRDIEMFKTERRKAVSPASVNHDLRAARAFFGRLVAWGHIKENPCRGIRDIRIDDTVRPFLSSSDLHRLLEHLEGTTLRGIVLFTAFTGLRRGEVVNLRWTDLDIVRGTITVKSSLSFRTKGGKLRVVPMNSRVVELLKSLPRRSEYVFPGDRGGKFAGNFLRSRFKKAVVSCGLDKKLNFHSLRHTFASLLVQQGVSLYHVQKLLGHSSPRVTEMYAHLAGNELRGTVEKLASI